MKRRGFFGRIFGAVTAAAVAPALTVETQAAEVAEVAIPLVYRPTEGPLHVPTFREAYAAAQRGEIWVDPRDATAVKFATNEQIHDGSVDHHAAYRPAKRTRVESPTIRSAYLEREQRNVAVREAWRDHQLKRAAAKGYQPNKRLRKEFARIAQQRRSLDMWKA